jgi:hypothetical protein
MPSSEMLGSVHLVRTDVSEECIASIVRVTKISVLGIILAVNSNRNTLRSTMHIVSISSQRVSIDIYCQPCS